MSHNEFTIREPIEPQEAALSQILLRWS